MTSDPNGIYEETIRVNAFECDFHQQWKPAAIFQHLTETAVIHAARLGVGFEAMMSEQLYWVHSRMKIQFISYPHTGDLITIRTWPKTIQQKLFYIRDFEAVDGDKRRVAAATSAWVIVNAATRRLAPPQSLDLNLPQFSDRVGLDEPLERLGLTEDGEERLRLRAGYSAVDILGHVNNSRYIEWVCDAFPMQQYRDRQIDWLQINYDHEILPGEEVALRVTTADGDGDTFAVEGHNCSNQTRAFETLLHWRDQPDQS